MPRNCEARCLQAKHFIFNAETSNPRDSTIPFFVVNLLNCKDWQMKMKSSGGILNGQLLTNWVLGSQHLHWRLLGNTYNIYEQPNNLVICMYTHVLAWIQFYEFFILCRKFTGNDYLFPNMAPKGSTFYPNESIDPDWIQQKLDNFVDFLGIPTAFGVVVLDIDSCLLP